MSFTILCDYLETYQGRDKILRTLSYAAKLATVVTPSKQSFEKKLKLFSSQMSNTRMVLRLLDDIPAFHHALSYKRNIEDPDRFIHYIELLQIIVDLIFNPIEHISWAGEQNIISIDTKSWDNASTWFWIVSLYLSLMKSLRKLKKLSISPSRKNLPVVDNKTQFSNRRTNELLTCIRLALDISYAVSYLPAGTLWGGYLKTWQVGALGTISSLVGLYQALNALANLKKNM